jgi:hypothetical protein
MSMSLIRRGTPQDFERAKNILSGDELITKSSFDKKAPFKMPKDAEVDFYLDQKMAGLDISPRLTHAMKRSAKALYAKKAQGENRNTDRFDKTLMDDAFNEAFGEPFDWNGYRYFAPTKGDNDGSYIEADRVESLLKGIDNSVLEKTHGSAVYDAKNKFPIENAISRMLLKPLRGEPGKFEVIIKKGGGTDNFYLLDKDKNHFVLDISKLDQGGVLSEQDESWFQSIIKYFSNDKVKGK